MKKRVTIYESKQRKIEVEYDDTKYSCDITHTFAGMPPDRMNLDKSQWESIGKEMGWMT